MQNTNSAENKAGTIRIICPRCREIIDFKAGNAVPQAQPQPSSNPSPPRPLPQLEAAQADPSPPPSPPPVVTQHSAHARTVRSPLRPINVTNNDSPNKNPASLHYEVDCALASLLGENAIIQKELQKHMSSFGYTRVLSVIVVAMSLDQPCPELVEFANNVTSDGIRNAIEAWNGVTRATANDMKPVQSQAHIEEAIFKAIDMTARAGQLHPKQMTNGSVSLVMRHALQEAIATTVARFDRRRSHPSGPGFLGRGSNWLRIIDVMNILRAVSTYDDYEAYFIRIKSKHKSRTSLIRQLESDASPSETIGVASYPECTDDICFEEPEKASSELPEPSENSEPSAAHESEKSIEEEQPVAEESESDSDEESTGPSAGSARPPSEPDEELPHPGVAQAAINRPERDHVPIAETATDSSEESEAPPQSPVKLTPRSGSQTRSSSQSPRQSTPRSSQQSRSRSPRERRRR